MPAGCGDAEGISGGLTRSLIRSVVPLIFYCLSDSLPACFEAAGYQWDTRRLDPWLFVAVELLENCKLNSRSPSVDDWFRTLIQNIDVAPVNEESVPLLSGSLADDRELLHVLDRFGNGGRRNRQLFGRRWNGENWFALHVLVYAENRRGGPTEPFDLPPVLLEQGEDLVRTLGPTKERD